MHRTVDDTDLLENRSGDQLYHEGRIDSVQYEFGIYYQYRKPGVQVAANQVPEKIQDTVYTRYGVVSHSDEPDFQ